MENFDYLVPLNCAIYRVYYVSYHYQCFPAPHLELKRAVDPLELHMEYLTPAQMIQTAEEWLALQGYPVPQEYGDTFEEYGVTVMEFSLSTRQIMTTDLGRKIYEAAQRIVEISDAI